jgi:hypothetical protein
MLCKQSLQSLIHPFILKPCIIPVKRSVHKLLLNVWKHNNGHVYQEERMNKVRLSNPNQPSSDPDWMEKPLEMAKRELDPAGYQGTTHHWTGFSATLSWGPSLTQEARKIRGQMPFLFCLLNSRRPNGRWVSRMDAATGWIQNLQGRKERQKIIKESSCIFPGSWHKKEWYECSEVQETKEFMAVGFCVIISFLRNRNQIFQSIEYQKK